MRARTAGLVLGFAADRLLGDPRRFHPVAGFGRAALALESRLHARSRVRGTAYWLVLVGGVTAAGIGAERLTGRRPVARTLLTAAATWSVLGGRSLEREALAVEALLGSDVVAARRRLTHLVGRRTEDLEESEVARAVVESVAENTSDAVVSSLIWGGVAGIPGLLGHRAANTLDAMVGHRSPRYQRFGWTSARADDLLNLPGSRLTAVLTVVLGGDRRSAWTTWRRDARRHPSPNAGPVEAAFAGALGLTLGGTNDYAGVSEHRPQMGTGRSPRPDDIGRATDLARTVGAGALVVAVAVSAGARQPSRPSR